jgi:hypothetical protein
MRNDEGARMHSKRHEREESTYKLHAMKNTRRVDGLVDREIVFSKIYIHILILSQVRPISVIKCDTLIAKKACMNSLTCLLIHNFHSHIYSRLQIMYVNCMLVLK